MSRIRHLSTQLVRQSHIPTLPMQPRTLNLNFTPVHLNPPIISSRRYTTPPPPGPSHQDQAQAITSKSPLIQRYAPSLHTLSQRTGVPLPSLVLSFMVLHELTAILPIFLIYWVFSTLGVGLGLVRWIMDVGEGESTSTSTSTSSSDMNGEVIGGEGDVVKKWIRGWYEEGEGRVAKIGRRYGVFGYDKVDKSEKSEETQIEPVVELGVDGGAATKVADAIAAYVVVKALLPVRIAASLGLAPAFARYTLVPLQHVIRRFRR
ncbi:hypothetical protein I302_100855 [Kwoniella bestiolae CBS 10118]|uniref:Uncharacterized protein n=1 Tax=Kwoniella bestiolae CBS 10118 TaxID=1296100 RepID=A0A1B9G6C6_9TREE|nr:hypothetical protein I302_04228 [Kwoniella bestiolae CBS 10118]OCF26542.1 hypothetical protein I302_04228 [Kwoniella bestiolae CBS 10118]